jgi:geranyl-CoA carboxylase beta subunit
MATLDSAIDPNSEEYRQNREALLAAIEEFRAIEQAVVDTAESKRAKFEKRGQLLPHERISRLLDAGSPFLSLMNLAGYQMHDDKDGTEAGGGTIAGIGYVSGVRCLVTASNSAIKGGTISPSGLHKTLRLQRIALENKLPVVSLVESGGANLKYSWMAPAPLPTKHACPPRVSPKSPWFMVTLPPVAPTNQACLITW